MKRKKLLSKAAAMMTAVLLVFGVSGQMVSAAEESAEQIGYIMVQPRGVYLQSGYSKITKPGDGKITAGGSTTAQKVVSEVSIDVFVERKVNGSWKHYTSWTSTKNNAIAITSYKTLTVPKGYYYRVRSVHYANSDVSSSATGGLYI
ncbi:DUF6147 family protein [Sellimonas catena]|uniref:Pectate lyase n=1 Tax=Sellimonas catena TaxID=2994035 RepID=A0A9W6C4P0_9FIRM|nr:DUF6147 family protein [Sellimonas catena]GLG03567.1 hypothetical protein Selli1_07410 [Sellimonas catena]